MLNCQEPYKFKSWKYLRISDWMDGRLILLLFTEHFVLLSGIRDFFADTRMYYTVATDIWSGRPLSTFTRKELQTYQQVNYVICQ